MRTLLPIVFLCVACGASPDKPGAVDFGIADLAQGSAAPVYDFSPPPPTIYDLAEAVDLAPPAPTDLTPASSCDGGSCNPGSCGAGQFMAAGECQTSQTAAQCEAVHRQYVTVGVGLIGYCGDCITPYQTFYGYCAMPMCGSSDGSLGALCAQLGRGCDDNGTGATAECAPCQSGTALDVASQACVKTSCQSRSDCPEIAGFYCTQLAAGDTPQCRKRPCATGQIWDRRASGASATAQSCTACSLCAGNEWPVSDHQGNCYCNASPGSFFDHSSANGSLELCDADGDGWIKETVKEELSYATLAPALDYTVVLNVQCTIPYFTSALLHNEWGQYHSLSLSDLGQHATVTGVAMYEDPANDTAGTISSTVDGTNIQGASVNSLTKACSSNTLDLNGNGVADFIEDQTTTQPGLSGWAADYQPLTYFTELYWSHFQTPPAPSPSPTPSPAPLLQLCTDGTARCQPLPLTGVPGVLVIEELSRCNAAFSMQHASTTDNWQDCERRRPNAYSSLTPLGYDFASYDCAPDSAGACSYTWPASWGGTSGHAAPPPAASGPSNDGTVPEHGLCNGGVGQTWMGMTAYSQFMCAQINDGSTQYNNDVSSSNVLSLTVTSAPWEALSCTVRAQSGAAGGPTLSYACPESPRGYASTVTWLEHVYSDYSSVNSYNGGCIDEAFEYPVLCPGSSSAPVDGANGQILCGPPCPSSETMAYTDTSGASTAIAMCLHATLNDQPFTIGGPQPSPLAPLWQLQGEIPVGTISGSVSGGCDGGATCWQIE